MAVIRMTKLRVVEGERAQAARVLDEINEFTSRQRGFILALRYASADGEEMGRIAIWESEEHADAVALLERNLALRSRLMEIVGDDPGESREESLYQVLSTPTPLPPARR